MASKRVVLLDEASFNTLQQLVRWWGNIHGPGVTNTRDGLTINPPIARRTGTVASASKIAINCFRIASSEADGNGRYVYTAKIQVKDADGYTGWADSSTDTDDYTLYNIADEAEASSAIDDDTRVFAVREQSAGGATEWWIIGSGSALPSGGSAYMVLSKDEDNAVVWDYPRAHS